MKEHFIFLQIGLVLLSAGCKPKQQAAGGPPKMEMQVVVVAAKQQRVVEKISLLGNLLADESVEIKSEIDGKVEEIKFQEGERVEQGQLLIRIDEGKLVSSVAEAEANFNVSQTTFDRTKQLSDDKLISKQEFDQAAATFQAREAELGLRKQLLKEARIVAPFAGIVGGRNVSPGQVIAKNTVLTWLTDLDPVKIEINVPERFIGALKVGQPIEIKVAAYPGKTFPGEVYFISQQLDPTTRTVLIKGKVPNPDSHLKPGMFANLNLTVAVREQAIVIPERGLSRVMNDNKAMVFIVDDKSTAQIRPVKLGIRLPGEVEIVEGLQAGEKVIVEGLQKIGPGSPVKIAAPASEKKNDAPASTKS